MIRSPFTGFWWRNVLIVVAVVFIALVFVLLTGYVYRGCQGGKTSKQAISPAEIDAYRKLQDDLIKKNDHRIAELQAQIDASRAEIKRLDQLIQESLVQREEAHDAVNAADDFDAIDAILNEYMRKRKQK